MFNTKRIARLEKRIEDLNGTLAAQAMSMREITRTTERRLEDQKDNHLMYGITIWDEDGPPACRKATIDVRDVVRELTKVLGIEIRIQKGKPSHVVLNKND